jgi:hypothetical protein
VRTEIGYDSMDLVVDLVVASIYDRHWKDERAGMLTVAPCVSALWGQR